MKGKNTARNKGKEKSGKLYGKIVLPKISGYKDWNMDSNENIKSKEVKNHGHKEITHQKPGHADNDENMDSNEKIKEDENNQNEREAIAS